MTKLTDMTTARDDRVLPQTRALGAFIVPFLLVAFPLLYLFPNDTGNWWAWDIRPSMTALLMGAGYVAGAYFFLRVAHAARWHRVHLGFLPITAFTTCLGIATFVHWDRFDHDHVAFRLWTGLYVTTPFVVPLAWLRNRRTDPGTRVNRRPPPAARRPVGPHRRGARAARGRRGPPRVPVDDGRHLALGADPARGRHARSLVRPAGRHRADDGDRRPLERDPHHAESQLIGLALILLAGARAWEQFDKSNALTYVFAGGIALLLVGLAGLWSSIALPRSAARHSPPHGRSLAA